MAKLDKVAIWEAVKLVVRMTVFALPIIINALSQLGLDELAIAFSGVLAFIDKALHEAKKIKLNGLLPF